MIITCHDILKLPTTKAFQLLGGRNGLKRRVSWPYICEDTSISKWVNGGEIAFVSGVGDKWNHFDLVEFVEEANKLNLAAIVFSINEDYISQVPAAVIEEADRLEIPVFQIPWEVKRLDVSKEISTYILKVQRKANNIDQIFELLLEDSFSDSQRYRLHHLLEQAGLDEDVPFYGMDLFIYEEKGKDDQYVLSSLILEKIKDYFDCSYVIRGRFIYKIGHNHMKILLNTKESKTVIIEKMQGFLQEIVGNDTTNSLYIGIGNKSKLEDVKRSLMEAEKAVAIISKKSDFGHIAFYEDLGIYRILLGNKSEQEIKDLCNGVIGDIERYDEANEGELTKTVVSYFNNSFNTSKTAEELFIHRNTLMYRLEKIEKITGKSMKNPYNVLEFIVCCMIRDL